MDWFEHLTGFREGNYDETRAKLRVETGRLHSLVNGKSYAAGQLEFVSLQTLRDRVKSKGEPSGRLKASIVTGDVRQLHRLPEYEGALFQVASQFNALEMTHYEVTPEHGVTRYERDHTQGPACAIAAGAATIYRNYFVPLAGGIGQTSIRQLDGLAAVGQALSSGIGRPVGDLWCMRNGYALCTQAGLVAISDHIATLRADEIDVLRGMLSIGVHWDVEVTDGLNGPGRLVTQAFCSALPVACTKVDSRHWRVFASLILEAAYEATMWAAAQRGRSNIVLLTLLGGGAFGNETEWIVGAIDRALRALSTFDVDARIVSYGASSHEVTGLIESLGHFSRH